MRGLPLFNFPAFESATNHLRALGHDVWSPAENDVDCDGFDPAKDPPRTMSHYMERDLPAVCRAEAIALLPGWEKSEGANLEVLVGRKLGKGILTYNGRSSSPALTPIDGDVRVTDPTTGGQKGQKLARFELIPDEALWELAEVYGRGAKKYSDNNWRKGYAWSLTIGALSRHLTQWRMGAQRDEDGNHHLMQVAWHCFTLYMFERFKLGTDDRAKAQTI